MKRKIFLVSIIIILTITNFILFKNFYNSKTNNEIKEEKNYLNIE